MFASMAPSRVEEALSDMDLDGLTPREALNRLYELRELMAGR
jgi:DNA mismatch repair protein MutS